MSITYKVNEPVDIAEVIEVYKSSTINRPVDDKQRISRMYEHSNLVVTAWDGNKLVGISRSLTDFVFCCYLSDLAVRRDYQSTGIGRRLIEITRKEISSQSMLLLLAAPAAMDYYPKVGFEEVNNGFIIKRLK